MKYWPHWGSHFPLLVEVMRQSSGDVLELGMGPFSTPLLHMLCFDAGRKLVSYENNKNYYDMHKHFHKPFHEVHYVKDWDKTDFVKPWSVAFIDHKPGKRRRQDVKNLAHCTQFMVVHDTQPEDDRFYGFSVRTFSKYKFRYDYTKIKPWTTVLSNFVNVKELFDEKIGKTTTR